MQLHADEGQGWQFDIDPEWGKAVPYFRGMRVEVPRALPDALNRGDFATARTIVLAALEAAEGVEGVGQWWVEKRYEGENVDPHSRSVAVYYAGGSLQGRGGAQGLAVNREGHYRANLGWDVGVILTGVPVAGPVSQDLYFDKGTKFQLIDVEVWVQDDLDFDEGGWLSLGGDVTVQAQIVPLEDSNQEGWAVLVEGLGARSSYQGGPFDPVRESLLAVQSSNMNQLYTVLSTAGYDLGNEIPMRAEFDGSGQLYIYVRWGPHTDQMVRSGVLRPSPNLRRERWDTVTDLVALVAHMGEKYGLTRAFLDVFPGLMARGLSVREAVASFYSQYHPELDLEAAVEAAEKLREAQIQIRDTVMAILEGREHQGVQNTLEMGLPVHRSPDENLVQQMERDRELSPNLHEERTMSTYAILTPVDAVLGLLAEDELESTQKQPVDGAGPPRRPKMRPGMPKIPVMPGAAAMGRVLELLGQNSPLDIGTRNGPIMDSKERSHPIDWPTGGPNPPASEPSRPPQKGQPSEVAKGARGLNLYVVKEWMRDRAWSQGVRGEALVRDAFYEFSAEPRHTTRLRQFAQDIDSEVDRASSSQVDTPSNPSVPMGYDAVLRVPVVAARLRKGDDVVHVPSGIHGKIVGEDRDLWHVRALHPNGTESSRVMAVPKDTVTKR